MLSQNGNQLKPANFFQVTRLELSSEAKDDVEIHHGDDILDFILGQDLTNGTQRSQKRSEPDPSSDPAQTQVKSTENDKNCSEKLKVMEQNDTSVVEKETITTCSNLDFNSIRNFNITINTAKGNNKGNESINNELLNGTKLENACKGGLEGIKESVTKQEGKNGNKKRIQEDKESSNDCTLTNSRLDRLLDELPKIEGIYYEPEFRCFKSRIPSRYSSFTEQSSFSVKRYGLKNAWLKAVSHLFTNIASSVFDFPQTNQTSCGHLPEGSGRSTSEVYGVSEVVSDVKENNVKGGADDMDNLDYDSFYETRQKKAKVSDIELKNIKHIKRFMINSLDNENFEDRGYEALLCSSRTNNKHVLSAEEQSDPKKIAESLRPWHQSVFWIPSISRWRTLYYDENSVRHTKTFTPAIFGGVREAYYAAVEFRNMIDNMDELTLPTIRRSWVKSNVTNTSKRPTPTGEDNFDSPERNLDNISKVNSNFNFSIQVNSTHKTVNCINTTNGTNINGNHKTDVPLNKLGKNNSNNVENKVCNNNREKDLHNNENSSNTSKEGAQSNILKGVDIDFLSGLDTKGLFIPIPLDWKQD
uniref:AP2 domain containing protein, putative n=1 Tax=Theileria annulata TaxID=5874 RepID=A0A3B0ML30_THEAN